MDDQNHLNIQHICQEFVNAFQENLSWKWEERFETALAEFNSSDKDLIHGILERYLINTWDSSTLKNAPADARQIVNKFGGLKDGQLLFTADPKQDGFLFGLWWPWGNGHKISLRVAPSFVKPSQPEYFELIKEFKGWFHI